MKKSNRERIAIISIDTHYAREIFNETKIYEFRKVPLIDDLLNTKIYVYSFGEDKALIGYFKVDNVLDGNTYEILKKTEYNKNPDMYNVVKYFGLDNPNCYAYHLYDVTEFDEYLSIYDIRNINKNYRIPADALRFIYDNDPLYNIIKKWDEYFSLDGKKYNNKIKEEQKIIKKSIKNSK